jgi:hypothetical protein
LPAVRHAIAIFETNSDRKMKYDGLLPMEVRLMQIEEKNSPLKR